MINSKDIYIAVIGLGYVGLPLAIEFSKKFKTIGFDINSNRVEELKNNHDSTLEVSENQLKLLKNLVYTNNPNEIKKCNIYIITVPTPVTKFKTPDLSFLISASKVVGGFLNKNNIVIYESTVYPGCTEEDCVPVLEKYSTLKYNIDFYGGYSPERINPGDKENKLTNIKKITSGSNPTVAKFIDKLYNCIIEAGTYLAPSIKVAEAAKVIENAQRDLNISFVNELALIFDKMDIDTNDVLDAAASKWNFMKFTPGIVGGHCIGVDPYYLASKSKQLGYNPQVILSGRRVNNYMSSFIASKTIKLLRKKNIEINKSKILILGFSFKENCPDFRNTKVIDIYNELIQYGVTVQIYDPLVDSNEVYLDYKLKTNESLDKYHAIILAVPHNCFKDIDFENLKAQKNSVIFDVKSFLDRKIVDGRL